MLCLQLFFFFLIAPQLLTNSLVKPPPASPGGSPRRLLNRGLCAPLVPAAAASGPLSHCCWAYRRRTRPALQRTSARRQSTTARFRALKAKPCERPCLMMPAATHRRTGRWTPQRGRCPCRQSPQPHSAACCPAWRSRPWPRLQVKHPHAQAVVDTTVQAKQECSRSPAATHRRRRCPWCAPWRCRGSSWTGGCGSWRRSAWPQQRPARPPVAGCSIQHRRLSTLLQVRP